MKFATALIFAAAAVAGKSSSKPEDCKDGEVWSPRFGQCLKEVKHKKCKDNEVYSWGLRDCVKVKKCKKDERFSAYLGQCIKISKGKGKD